MGTLRPAWFAHRPRGPHRPPAGAQDLARVASIDRSLVDLPELGTRRGVGGAEQWLPLVAIAQVDLAGASTSLANATPGSHRRGISPSAPARQR